MLEWIYFLYKKESKNPIVQGFWTFNYRAEGVT